MYFLEKEVWIFCNTFGLITKWTKENFILNPETLQRVYFPHGYVLLQPPKGDADDQVKQYVYMLPVLIGLLMSKKAEFLRDPL